MPAPIVIIGAGAAGLAAADALLDAGLEPLVLEASPQPGGRVRALEGFADFPIELGAEEVHGTENSVFTLVEKTGTEIIRHLTADDRLRLDGRLFSLKEAAQDDDVAHVLEVLRTIGDYAGPNWTASEWFTRNHFPRRAWHYLDSRLGVENGTSLDRLALRGFAGYERGWENREWNFTLRGRYLDLFAPLLARLGPRLWTGCPVVAVDWRQQPLIHLADGREMAASAILVTVSVPVLRDGVIDFSPKLPRSKLQACQAVGMDGGMKILLKFRKRFWEERMYFLHTDGFLPQFWATGKGKSAAAVLTAFVGGARYDWLRGQGVDPVDFALGELDQIFGGEVATQFFQEGFVADWGADPWVRGLYSYPTLQTTPAVREELARSLAGRLFFAGEATDCAGHSGTVHGAIDSGRRAAREILLQHGPGPRFA